MVAIASQQEQRVEANGARRRHTGTNHGLPPLIDVRGMTVNHCEETKQTLGFKTSNTRLGLGGRLAATGAKQSGKRDGAPEEEETTTQTHDGDPAENSCRRDETGYQGKGLEETNHIRQQQLHPGACHHSGSCLNPEPRCVAVHAKGSNFAT